MTPIHVHINSVCTKPIETVAGIPLGGREPPDDVFFLDGYFRDSSRTADTTCWGSLRTVPTRRNYTSRPLIFFSADYGNAI